MRYRRLTATENNILTDEQKYELARHDTARYMRERRHRRRVTCVGSSIDLERMVEQGRQVGKSQKQSVKGLADAMLRAWRAGGSGRGRLAAILSKADNPGEYRYTDDGRLICGSLWDGRESLTAGKILRYIEIAKGMELECGFRHRCRGCGRVVTASRPVQPWRQYVQPGGYRYCTTCNWAGAQHYQTTVTYGWYCPRCRQSWSHRKKLGKGGTPGIGVPSSTYMESPPSSKSTHSEGVLA